LVCRPERQEGGNSHSSADRPGRRWQFRRLLTKWVRVYRKCEFTMVYPVYFVQRGIEMVILLAGGDKSTQSKDIETALQLASKLEEDDMTLKLRKWDSVEYLKTEEEMALYLEACIEEAGDDAAFIAKALGTIARARGMSQLAKDTGLGRESLYKALSGDGNPSFATILKVTHALGFKLHVQGQGKDIKKITKIAQQ
jgi:probable addiction module antidote protein